MRENLIPFPYYNNTITTNGITYTVRSDGGINVNGTATGTAQFNIKARRTTDTSFKSGKYRLSGIPKGKGTSGFYLQINDTVDGNAHLLGRDIGDGVIVDVDTSVAIGIIIIVGNGHTINNVTVYPQLIKVFDYTQPKTDWIANDYFNITDYERIVGNIIETQDFASSLYSGYDIAEMMENVNYESIPHADNWNVISENIGTINQHTYNLPLEPSEVYVDNGYAPNYEEFNRWESSIERLMTTLRVEVSTIPRLAKTLGRPMIGNR